MTSSTRLWLGVAALGLLGGGVAVFVWGSDEAMGGVLIRVGLMLGAAWLVAPLVRRPSLATLGGLAVVALVVFRPRLILPVVLGAVLWRFASRRPTSD
jgi:hypothetical protein